MSRSREIFVDENTRLKEIDLDDVEVIFKTIDKERAYLEEWLPFVELTREISFTRSFVENYLNSDRTDLTCAIYFQQQFAGIIGLKDTDLDNKKTEIGYWLSESFQHRGIITRSCKSLIHYAFNKMDLNRVQLKAATGNLKSQRVAERLGFRKEGIERDGELHSSGFVDLVVYSLLKADN
ncbi:MAG: GNAT family protein [Bacteroidota bacterium]|nr:GNAT family protein [Bacteroidota bacterium]